MEQKVCFSDSIDKAKILLEALPYFKAFNNKTVVIKYGGSAMVDEGLQASVLKDIVMMKYIGMKPVIVHGGGNEISGLLKKVGKKAKFINGYRVTDEETMEIAEMVLSGKVGKNIVRHLQVHGVNAVGISGKDACLLVCEKKKGAEELGLVGDIKEVNPQLVNTLLDDGFIPVISPVGMDEEGNTYNINADHAASAIAGALEAEKLVFMTDVAGVYTVDHKGEKDFIKVLYSQQIQQMISSGEITGGMIPKLLCCKEAIGLGTKQVHILNGCMPHSLLLEVFTRDGAGTMVLKGDQFGKEVAV